MASNPEPIQCTSSSAENPWYSPASTFCQALAVLAPKQISSKVRMQDMFNWDKVISEVFKIAAIKNQRWNPEYKFDLVFFVYYHHEAFISTERELRTHVIQSPNFHYMWFGQSEEGTPVSLGVWRSKTADDDLRDFGKILFKRYHFTVCLIKPGDYSIEKNQVSCCLMRTTSLTITDI
jgi:hypothetical protein